MTFLEIAKQRLINQQLAATQLQSAAELVGWLGAVQAQEYAPAKWAIGLRLRHLSDEDVEREFTEGRILRTHLLRPTWHFVTAQDIRWLLMLTAPRVHQANAFMYRKLELGNAFFLKTNDLIVKALEGGKCLTREAINEEFRNANISAKGDRLSYIMMAAELAGLICSGPRQGNQFTYALLDERVPATEPISYGEALYELTRRYFSSRGPATINDFSTWSGLTLTDCRKGLQLADAHLVKYTVDGVDYYGFSDAAESLVGNDVHLLPMYDEWIMGYKDRSATMAFRNSLQPGSPFQFGCMIISEGQIIGTWKRLPGNKSVRIETDFFSPLTQQQRQSP